MRLFLLLFLAGVSSLFAGGPESCLLVVNADSWASTWIANEYIAARDIPSTNVIWLRDLPSFERMNVADFRRLILAPALATAEKRGLSGQLDNVLYSADFPTAIDTTEDMAGKPLPKPISQPASLTGLTYFYQLVLAKNPNYLGLTANFYFRQLAQVAPEEAWAADDQLRYGRALKVLQAAGEKRSKDDAPPLEAAERAGLQGARDELLALKTGHPKSTELLYNLACMQAQLGEPEAAIAALREAMEHGWWDMRHAAQDSDLRSLRERADFKELAAHAKDAKFELAPTSGFRGNVGWLKTGQPVPPGQGLRYLLSTMLAYTSGRGTSAAEAIAGLRRSVAADGSRPAGTIYFLANDDVRSKTREWGFARAVEKLGGIGVKAVVERGTLPQNKADVAGLVAGTADFSWSKSGSTLLPGAIAEHLTSFGGMLHEGDGQTPLTEFLRNGAAGASGTVGEPYAIQQKFPTPFIHWHYAQGCTLAEAFYQSVNGPYQLLIVGDALCAPWRKPFTVSVPDLEAGATVRGKLAVEPKTASAAGLVPALFELFLDGRRVASAKPGTALEFDTSRAPEGPHQLQVVALAGDALATPARLSIPVVVRNTDAEISVTPAIPAEWGWDQPLKLHARSAKAEAIAFFLNGREIGRIAGEEGDLTIDPRELGQGPVRVQPAAVLGVGKECWGAPLAFRVIPPKPHPALALPEGRKAVDGFYVAAHATAPVAVAMAEADWLAKAGVARDGDFAVEAWFQVDASDTYQFQLHGPAKLKLLIDGEAQDWPRGKEWWYVPVSLAAGWHRVRIEGRAEGAPALDVRFGGPGSYRLNGTKFRHLE